MTREGEKESRKWEKVKEVQGGNSKEQTHRHCRSLGYARGESGKAPARLGLATPRAVFTAGHLQKLGSSTWRSAGFDGACQSIFKHRFSPITTIIAPSRLLVLSVLSTGAISVSRRLPYDYNDGERSRTIMHFTLLHSSSVTSASVFSRHSQLERLPITALLRM